MLQLYSRPIFVASLHLLNLFLTMAEKITKKKLLQEMDEKLQELNLLKSALEGDSSRKQEDLDNYKKQFYTLINKKK
jgi:hypothetical protein